MIWFVQGKHAPILHVYTQLSSRAFSLPSKPAEKAAPASWSLSGKAIISHKETELIQTGIASRDLHW